MKKIMPLAASIVVILVAGVFASAGTLTLLSDTETSNGNTFTATSLDLKLDDGDVNVVKWTVNNMKPGSQAIRTFKLTNVGTLAGYLDLENIVVTDYENGRIDPETNAGDITDGVGELSSVVKINFFVDNAPSNGWYGVEDVYFFPNGFVNTLPTNFDLNEPIPAGGTIYISAQVNWWSTPNDNQAMTDSFVLDIGFELAQTAGQ